MRRFLLLLAIAACADDFPVKWEVCEVEGTKSTNCEIRARFRDFETCERYTWWAMNCCETPEEGHINCGGTCQATFVVAHCTR